MPNKRRQLITKFSDDSLLGELIELMLSPEYNHGYAFAIEPIKPEPTTPTKKTFITFRSMLHRKDKRLEAFIARQDAATKFVYKHIANQTDLSVPFTFIAKTFNLLNRFNYNEYCMDYGFPELPCYAQIMPSNRQMVNVKVNDIATATFIDGRLYKQMHEDVLTEICRLHLKGDFTGFVSENTYFITNYYPKVDHVFSRRILAVESAIARVSEDTTFSKVQVVPAFMITKPEQLFNLATTGHDIICKQDTVPSIGKSKNMIKLGCDQLLKLKKVKERSKDA